MKIFKNMFQTNCGLEGRFCDSSDRKCSYIVYMMEHMWRNLMTQIRQKIFNDRYYCYFEKY